MNRIHTSVCNQDTNEIHTSVCNQDTNEIHTSVCNQDTNEIHTSVCNQSTAMSVCNQDIIDTIVLKLFSDDATEQEVFKIFLKKLKIDKNVFKFVYDEQISLTKLSNTVRLKLYHTLVRMILTNNPNIITNIGALAAQQNNITLMELCECYMEIHHKDKLSNYYLNIFISLIRCPKMIYIKYVKFFSQFEWYYEQYDIFLIEILLRNRIYEIKLPNTMSDKLSEIILSITIKYNLFDIFVLYFNTYFKGIKFYTAHIISLCINYDNCKIMKYISKKIKFKGTYKNNPSNKTEKFLKGILFYIKKKNEMLI